MARTLRTLIVDDEPLALGLLRSMLEAMDSVEVTGEAVNGRQAIDLIVEQAPDLLFLDIQMPGINGFEVVKALQADTIPMVIFATAYDQYALDAFDMHAVDYVLKPLDPKRVQRAVQRALSRVEQQEDSRKQPLIGAIDDIVRKINQSNEGPEKVLDEDAAEAQHPSNTRGGLPGKLLIRDAGTLNVVPFADIDWIDAAGDYMCIHTEPETYILRSTLKELLQKLDPSLFRQIHRSTIVNINSIVEISPLPKGERKLQLTNGHLLKVSRSYRNSLLDLLG